MKHIIRVCTCTGCQANGSLEIFEGLCRAASERKKECEEKGVEIEVKETGCIGLSETVPNVLVDPSGILYVNVNENNAEKIVDSVINNYVIDEMLFEIDGKKYGRLEDVPFFALQDRVLLARCGYTTPLSLSDYTWSGGFEGLKKALDMPQDEVIEILKNSKLRGRGGAGFLTGLKWGFLKNAKGDEKFLVCNADEGDPGAFMDRSLLESDPFAVLEGMLIGAYATGATRGFIYIREEYPLAIDKIKTAIDILRENGYLGDNVLGRLSFDIEIRKGAGAFVCGEETALMNSVEGKRGQPRIKPPFPAERGIFGKPTNINNVKTYAFVPLILRNGAEWFLERGDGKSAGGTLLICLTGKIRLNGVVEVKMGTPLRKVIYDIGGGLKSGKKLKGIQTGGPSGGCIPEPLIDTEIGYETMQGLGSIIGSGGVICIDEDDSIIDLCIFFLDFLEKESCGQCTPCREGIVQMKDLIIKIKERKATEQDIATLERLAVYVRDNSLCGLGQTSPNVVLSSLKYFRDEFERKISGKPVFKINGKCTGCHLCLLKCPVKAITGNPKEKHEIIQDKCIGCGICYDVCKFKAIDKE